MGKMRATSKATIKFGLVTCPVGVYKVVDPHKDSLRQLHGKCKARIQYQKVCSSCGKKVDNGDIVKGYETEKDKYIVVEDTELEALKVESDKVIQINYFTNMDEINPLALTNPQALGTTDKAFASIYNMLHSILASEGKGAVGTFCIRGKEKNVVVFSLGQNLMMAELLSPDEIRAMPEVEAELPDKEALKLASQLIKKMTKKFNHSLAVNHYHEDLMEVVKTKMSGKEVKKAEKKEASKQSQNVMDALRASLS